MLQPEVARSRVPGPIGVQYGQEELRAYDFVRRSFSEQDAKVSAGGESQEKEVVEQLHYHHMAEEERLKRRNEFGQRDDGIRSQGDLTTMETDLEREQSDYNSSIDLLNIPHAQQMARHCSLMENSPFRPLVDSPATDIWSTLEMYRAILQKTQDSDMRYEFAVRLVEAAQEAEMLDEHGRNILANDRSELLLEAKQTLQKLADQTYVHAHYFLADGYFSGLFNDGKPDHERAFPWFVSAGKHGHAESSYRAGLCYEFGWGCAKNYAKAVQFYRQAGVKNHPGASTRLGIACIDGDLGLTGRQREGINWLKRAVDTADSQYNQAPFQMALLHVHGLGDDVFKDESYAATLFTQAAELGHAEANLVMGEAYEYGLLTCPRDPALSIHFYNGAAEHGIPKAMMALCAWYLVGADPVLPKDEMESYEWAKLAAEAGYPKAEYAVGYFTEMGIGCRRDPLEANVWYVRAAENGSDHAKQRLETLRTAEIGLGVAPSTFSTLRSPGLRTPSSVAPSSSSMHAHSISSRDAPPSSGDQDASSGATVTQRDTKDDQECLVM